MSVLRQILLLCLALGADGAWAASAGGPTAAESLPEWIWPDGDRNGVDTAAFQKSFTISGGIESARLRITADFASADITINGKPAAAIEPYDPPLDLDIRHLLSTGTNRIEILARGVPGPSAIAATARIALQDGETMELLSDRSWSSEPGSALAAFGPIDPDRWAPNRLPDISPFAEYNQWKEAVPDGREQLSPLPPGFAIDRLRASHEGEDSWVSMAIDPKGRLIIAREQRGLLRMTLPEDDGGEIMVEVIDDSLEECRGLLWHGDALYANANRSRALFRLRDTDGDDRFDETILLQATDGQTGHGRNDLALGPDGRVHAIHGDNVLVPHDARLRTVEERGAPEELGHWVSTSVSGDGWEIHARGLRNPFGIDFNRDGEPFTYDADNEGDVGLPFYRPTRINHLVSGANYGWHQDRGNTRSLTIYAPDSLPATFDVGRGSPTAVKFGTRSNFPPPYRDALFALDWAYGRIICVHLTPRGASYYASGDVFLEGRPLNVTDLDFDADGAMFFVTGGRKTQSALYRVRYTGDPPPAVEKSPTAQAQARSEFSTKARELRRRLERNHGNPDPPDFEDAWAALGDADPWIRHAARVAVESQAPARWRLRALGAENTLHGLTALLALARAGRDVDRAEAVRRLAAFEGDGWNRTEKLTALRIYELGELATQGLDETLAAQIRLQVEPWLFSGSDPVRREVVRTLVAIDSPDAVTTGLRCAAQAGDQLERLHYLELLSEARSGWSPELRSAYFRALAHAKRLSFGDRFMEGFFQTIETNALAGVENEIERAEYAGLLAPGQTNALEPVDLPVRKVVNHWAVEDFADVLEGSLGDRDLERGQQLFEAALCGRCHVAGTRGRPVGPDLTTVASRFSRRDLLEAIIDPSKVVAEVHRNVVIRRKDGTVVQGRIIQNDFRKSLLFLAANPLLPGDLTEIAKSDVESFEESPVSPMPPGLLDTLTREEVLDLVAWLESGGP